MVRRIQTIRLVTSDAGCDSDVASVHGNNTDDDSSENSFEKFTQLSLLGTQLSLNFCVTYSTPHMKLPDLYEPFKSARGQRTASARPCENRFTFQRFVPIGYFVHPQKRQLTSNSYLITERYSSLTNTDTREVQRKSLLQQTPQSFQRLHQNDPEQCDLLSDQPQLI